MTQQIAEDQIIDQNSQQITHSYYFGRITKIILIQIINYFKFTQITPAVLMYAGMIGLIFVVMQETIGPQFLTLPFYIISLLLGRDPNKPQSLGADDFTSLYLIISFVLFLIVSILGFILKFRINISFKKKILSVLLVPIIFYTFFFFYIQLQPPDRVDSGSGTWIFVCIFLSLATIAAGIYAIFISNVLEFVIALIEKNEERGMNTGFYHFLVKFSSRIINQKASSK